MKKRQAQSINIKNALSKRNTLLSAGAATRPIYAAAAASQRTAAGYQP
jgi:hypothetical protein